MAAVGQVVPLLAQPKADGHTRQSMDVEVATIVSQRDFGTIFAVEGGNGRSFKVLVPGKAMSAAPWSPSGPMAGETWHVAGHFTSSAKWGRQFHADVAYRKLPNGDGVRRFLAQHVPGIGDERAKRLWERFGADLPRTLKNDTYLPVIAEVLGGSRPRLGARLAVAAMQAWKEAEAEINLIEWLMLQGIVDMGVARRIHRLLGPGAVQALQSNPWMLIPHMSWSKVDEIGKRILAQARVAERTQDVRRLTGAVDAAVKSALEDGHTAMEQGWLVKRLSKLLGVTAESPLVHKALKAGRENQAIVAGANAVWRSPGAALMEDAVKARLEAMAAPVGVLPLPIPSEALLERLLASVEVPEVTLHPEQREAVRHILRHPLSCLQGVGGTGKTFTIRTACDAFEKMGGKVVMAAVAGKAALRLSLATGRKVLSLFRTLGELEERGHIEQSLLDGSDDSEMLRSRLEELVSIDEKTLVVIDEASMVGLPSFHALLRYMPEGARLLLVGDGGQLPPVEFGLVFHKLVKDPALTYTLVHVHRQAKETGIPDAGAKVRGGQLPDFIPYQGRTKGVSLVPADPSKLASTVEEIALDLGGYQNGVMIVTPTKSRDAGVRELNANLHLRFVSGGNVPCVHGFRQESFSVGEPVMFLRNDYKRGLFNGLLGQVEALTEQGGLKVKFDGQAQSEELVAADLLDLTPAYAITCHKMQGSQAPVVVVPLYKTGLLDPSWIYTAISRAVEQCVFVGPVEVLKEGLGQPCVADQRLVGFEWV